MRPTSPAPRDGPIPAACPWPAASPRLPALAGAGAAGVVAHQRHGASRHVRASRVTGIAAGLAPGVPPPWGRGGAARSSATSTSQSSSATVASNTRTSGASRQVVRAIAPRHEGATSRSPQRTRGRRRTRRSPALAPPCRGAPLQPCCSCVPGYRHPPQHVLNAATGQRARRTGGHLARPGGCAGLLVVGATRPPCAADRAAPVGAAGRRPPDCRRDRSPGRGSTTAR